MAVLYVRRPGEEDSAERHGIAVAFPWFRGSLEEWWREHESSVKSEIVEKRLDDPELPYEVEQTHPHWPYREGDWVRWPFTGTEWNVAYPLLRTVAEYGRTEFTDVEAFSSLAAEFEAVAETVIGEDRRAFIACAELIRSVPQGTSAAVVIEKYRQV